MKPLLLCLTLLITASTLSACVVEPAPVGGRVVVRDGYWGPPCYRWRRGCW